MLHSHNVSNDTCGHACTLTGLPGLLGSFVPNDVSLGGEDSPAFIVLTGPNMGERFLCVLCAFTHV